MNGQGPGDRARGEASLERLAGSRLPAPTPPPATLNRPRIWWPLLLFVATAASTAWAGGPVFAGAVMTILVCHELGHFLQARRYGVEASWPYFLPLPQLSPFGTVGSVIAMRAKAADGRGLYDIAISGPIAGLIPTLLFIVPGLQSSRWVPAEQLSAPLGYITAEPLLLQWLSSAVLGKAPAGFALELGPLGTAAWFGVFVTAINLLPIGQLDGGHILFTLTPQHAYAVGRLVFAAALVATLVFKLWHWALLLIVLFVIGLRHPPAADRPPFRLGKVRRILGWAMLLFVFIGLTPTPIRWVGP